jgi:hypothetical protein
MQSSFTYDDYSRWSKIKDKFGLKWHDRSTPAPQILAEIQKIIEDSDDPACAYRYAQEFKTSIPEMQAIIIRNKNAYYARHFASHVKGADLKAMEEVVIDSGDKELICDFGIYIPSSDRKRIEVILSTGKCIPKTAFMWIRYVKTADVELFKEVLLKSKRPRYVVQLAVSIKKKITPEDLVKIEDIVIKSGSLMYVKILARDLGEFGVNIRKLENVVLQSGDHYHMKQFANAVPSSTRIRKFLNFN